MYQIGICDDEPDFLEYLSVLITRILFSLGIACRIHAFRNAKELIDYFSQENPPVHFDLLFLNLVLEKENSLQLADCLCKNGNNIPVLSVTNNMAFSPPPRNFAESSCHQPQLRDWSCFSETLKRTYKNFKKNIMVIDTPSQTISFHLDDVLYIDIYDKTLSVHMQNGSVLKAMTNLSSLLKKLPQEQFMQCHRSYVVSLPAISSLCRYTIQLKNQETIPVSKKRYKDVQNALLTFLTSQSFTT